MSEMLAAPVREEQELAGLLREASLRKIEESGQDEAARRLGLSVAGLDSLLWRDQWALTQALRVAVALGAVDEHSVESMRKMLA